MCNFISKVNLPQQKNIRILFKKVTKCVIELDKKVYFCFIKVFWGVATFRGVANWNFILRIFAEKIFFCQALKEKALSILNWFIDRTFILIPGIQFELIL